MAKIETGRLGTLAAEHPAAWRVGDNLGVAFLLAQLGAHATERIAERLAAIGLSPAHIGLVRAIAATPGLSQHAVAERVGVHPSRIVALIDDLERHGFVERRRNPDDRRLHALYAGAHRPPAGAEPGRAPGLPSPPRWQRPRPSGAGRNVVSRGPVANVRYRPYGRWWAEDVGCLCSARGAPHTDVATGRLGMHWPPNGDVSRRRTQAAAQASGVQPPSVYSTSPDSCLDQRSGARLS